MNISTTGAPPTAAFLRSPTPLAVDEPLDGFDSIFFGDPDKSFAKADAHIGSSRSSMSFGEGLTLRNRTLLRPLSTNSIRTSSRPAVNEAAETVTLNRPTTTAPTRQNLFSQTDLVWENRLGGIDQTLLFGFEVGRQNSRNRRTDRHSLRLAHDVVPLSDPTVDLDGSSAFSAVGFATRTTAPRRPSPPSMSRTRSASRRLARDRRWPAVRQLQAGGRRPPAFGTRSSTAPTISGSPRLGLVLKPRDNLSFYASYQPLLPAAIGRPVRRPRHQPPRR